MATSYAQILDTLCVEGGRQSNLAVPHHPGATYYWNLGGGGQILSDPDSNDVFIDWVRQRGLFPISVYSRSADGCWGDTSRAFVFLTIPNPVSILGPERVCKGTSVELTALAGSNFAWQGNKSAQTISFTAEEDTTIFLVAYNSPCDNDTVFHTVRVEEMPRINFDGPNDTIPVQSYQDFVMLNENLNGIEWLVNGQSVSVDPYYIHHFTSPGVYRIGMVGYHGLCQDTITRSYFVTDHFAVHIPNAFTPNGDGLNEEFLIKGVGIKSYRVLIYSRWGQLIYQYDNNSEFAYWDGYFPNGQEAESGVYVYKIYVEDYFGGEHPYQGSIRLLR